MNTSLDVTIERDWNGVLNTEVIFTFKVPLLWVMKGWHACKVKKHFHFLIICISFYLICSTTSKWFAQRFIFPNPSFGWRQSAVIGRFHLQQCLWAFNAPKAAPSGKEWICTFIQTNAKIKFSQVCACNKWVGNMLMFHVDVNMKRLGIHFKNDSFKWFRVDSFFWETDFIHGALSDLKLCRMFSFT